MLHEMSEMMEDLLKEQIRLLEGELIMNLNESIADLKHQEPLDPNWDGDWARVMAPVDPAWEGTSDQETLENRIAHLNKAVEHLNKAVECITDAIEE